MVTLYVEEIPVIQSLQAKVTKLEIALGVERFAHSGQIEFAEALIEQIGIDPFFDKKWEIGCVTHRHIGVGRFVAQYFVTNGVQQQTRGD